MFATYLNTNSIHCLHVFGPGKYRNALGKPQKSYFFRCPATKREGGKGQATKKK